MSAEDWTEPVVWIAQETRRMVNGELVPVHDTTKAGRFGRRRVLVPERIKPWDTEPAIVRIRASLGGSYKPNVDYLLLIGGPLVCALTLSIAGGIARDLRHSMIKLLYWNGREQEYSELILSVEDIT